MKCWELSFQQVTFKCLLASDGGVTKTGGGASLWVKGHIKAGEAGGISVEEAFEASRLREVFMEVSVGTGRGPKIELVGALMRELGDEGGQQQLRVKGTVRESGV